MKIAYYRDVERFAQDSKALLQENELLNNLPIGILGRAAGEEHPEWLMAIVRDDAGEPLLCALRTPPKNLILSAAADWRTQGGTDAMNFLARECAQLGEALPGVIGEKALVSAFADAYGKGAALTESLNLMLLTQVADPQGVAGAIRPIQERDLFYLPHWRHAFNMDCNQVGQSESILEDVERIRASDKGDNWFIWEDGIPVSMAVNNRNTGRYATIGNVYTPPHYRGKGYASACVAALSHILLERGYEGVCLFADAANPISNKIYHRIGYKDVGVWAMYAFEPSAFAEGQG